MADTTGIILAAGLGKRMRPLTSFIPKLMLPVLGIPLFELIAGKLLRSGASGLHANLHHLPEQIRDYASSRNWPLTFHFEDRLLDTGGGIGHMALSPGDDDIILLHNGDVLSNIDFGPAMKFHRERGALFTMILVPETVSVDPGRRPPASVTLNSDSYLTEIGERGEGAAGSSALGYTGMAVLSPGVLEYFPGDRKVGLVEILLEIVKKRPGAVVGYDAGSGNPSLSWGEVGSPVSYLDLHRRIYLDREIFDPALPPPPLPIRTGEKSSLDPGTEWKGFLDIGAHAVIGKQVVLENCIVMDNTVIPAGTSGSETIFYPEGRIKVRQ
ncbi:MAG: hypothetical protein JXB45_05710 [Candidatus Krumholzibacteriota bacterium]|nr:hypothetical protein [Candidatus Krumholzibacteriota bacterium]